MQQASSLGELISKLLRIFHRVFVIVNLRLDMSLSGEIDGRPIKSNLVFLETNARARMQNELNT